MFYTKYKVERMNENYKYDLQDRQRAPRKHLRRCLEKHIRFLGFIDREEQLCLLDNSIAVIQPSLFEGWSTVVEDARALNKFIILSGLDVHQEQINENVHFFNPKNEKELAKILNRYYVEKPKTVILDYKNNIKEFANKFIDLVEV